MTVTGSPPDPKRTRAGAQFAFTPVARPNLIVIAWRWRHELATAAGLPVSAVLLAHVIGTPAIFMSFLILAGAVAILPPARRLATAWAWCVITPHRIRTGCAQAWIHSREGKIPIILLTRPEPSGERVQLWCRAGTSIEDFYPARRLLAAACWAHDLQFARSERYAPLVTIHVIRRPAHPGPGQDIAPSTFVQRLPPARSE